MNINPLLPVEIYEKAECLYEWSALIKQLTSAVTYAGIFPGDRGTGEVSEVMDN